MRKPLAVSVAVLAAVLGLTACGGDDSDDDTSSATQANGPAPTAPVTLAGKVNDRGTEDLSQAGATTELDLEADDFYFEPTFIEAAPGQKVTVEIENEGDATHTFTDPARDIDEELAPGATASVEITVPDTGNVEFYCRFHRASGMQGAFFTG